MPLHHQCPGCGREGAHIFHSVAGVPVHSVTVLRSPAEARNVATGDIALAFCPGCGFIFNAAYDAAVQDYFHGYVSTQAHSQVFDAFHRRLAQDLIRRHGLTGKRVVEIGCGQGEFLRLLCEMGGNQGLGFDPAYDEAASPPSPRVRIVKDRFSGLHGAGKADFVCCKMTLEHIGRTGEFMAAVRAGLSDDAGQVVFFQVPDVDRILAEGAFWDIYYEHCSYFSASSLTYLFERSGFAVTSVRRDYDGQYLMIEAHPAPVPHPPPKPARDPALAAAVARFAAAQPARLAAWRDELRRQAGQGRRTVLWGGGSKAVAFLTTLGLGDEIDRVVDINPDKYGTFLAGTGHGVVAPEALRDGVDRVVVMNPIYVGEVGARLATLGLSPEVVPVTNVLGVPA